MREKMMNVGGWNAGTWTLIAGVGLLLGTPGAAQSAEVGVTKKAATKKAAPGKAAIGKAGTENRAAVKRSRPSKEARAALRGVAAQRKAATGKKGEARRAVLVEVAQAYAKLSQDFVNEPVVVAQASFAAAENWRASGNADAAKPLYRRAIELDAERFGARAHLQLAHLARRGKDLTRAIASYRRVDAMASTSTRGHLARLWIGRCQLQQEGQVAVALQTFQAAIDRAPSPRHAIDACNRLANALVKLGRLGEAQQVVQRAESESKKSVRAGKKGAAVRAAQSKAFETMSSRRALQRALDKKNKVHQDALDVERSGRDRREAPSLRGLAAA